MPKIKFKIKVQSRLVRHCLSPQNGPHFLHMPVMISVHISFPPDISFNFFLLNELLFFTIKDLSDGGLRLNHRAAFELRTLSAVSFTLSGMRIDALH